MAGESQSEPKIKYGVEFGVALKRYFDSPPYASPALEARKRWTNKAFATACGVSEKSVRNWLNGTHLASDNIDTIERVLFGADQKKFRAEITQLRDILTRCEYRQREKHPLPESPVQLSAVRTYSDPTGDMLSLNYIDIDTLPVEENWRFDTIRYGEGVQMVKVPGSKLFWLDPACKMVDLDGERRSLTAFFPTDADALRELAARHELFCPRRIIITGPKRLNALVRIFACTDIPYENGLDSQTGIAFEAEAYLGTGGISAFVDRHGALRERSGVGMGNGLGCVVALVAIAYVHRRPAYRSPYCLAIRKGIRYPDDVWISPATGQPVFSPGDPAQGRFLFQSRESRGGGTDMFAANFNGSFMVNLNATDESAWDGFVDEDGNDLVSWTGNRITFGSRVTGKGFVERITREDRP